MWPWPSHLRVICHHMLRLDIDYLWTKFDHSSFSCFRDMVGAHHNLNGVRDQTTPLSGTVCHPQWSVTSSRCKWRRRQRLKMEGFPTLKGSWPWPWIDSYCIPLCITHRHLPTTQIPLKSNNFFVDGWTYVEYTQTDGGTDRHLRLTLLGRLKRVDLKMCCRNLQANY